MAASAAELTRQAIESVKTATVGAPEPVTVSATDESTRIYKVLSSVAAGVAPVLAETERALFALSYLGAKRRHLDNVLRDINVVRMKGETDDSLRRNASLIFVPNSRPSTEIDPEKVEEEADQADDVHLLTQVETLALQQARIASRVGGVLKIESMGGMLQGGVAVCLGELLAFLENIVKDYVTEDSEDLADTRWCYEFSALRVPGTRQAYASVSNYNEITIRVIVTGLPSSDTRGRRVVYSVSDILTAVDELARHYLPQPDRRTLREPTLRILPAVERLVLVEAAVGGSAVDLEAVEEAIETYFNETKVFGGGPTTAGIADAAMAVPGVHSFVMGSPSPGSLIVPENETVGIGAFSLHKV